LNEAGKDLQRIAQYMILADEGINQRFQTEVDHLNIFYVRAKPRVILETMVKLYSGGLNRMEDLFGKKWGGSSSKIVKRLKQFNLASTSKVQAKRLERCVYPTEAGQLFFNALLSVMEHIGVTEEENNQTLAQYMSDGKWSDFIRKNGLGWSVNTKTP